MVMNCQVGECRRGSPRAGALFIKASQEKLEKWEGVRFEGLQGISARKAVLLVTVMGAHALGEGSGVGVSFCGDRGWAQVPPLLISGRHKLSCMACFYTEMHAIPFSRRGPTKLDPSAYVSLVCCQTGDQKRWHVQLVHSCEAKSSYAGDGWGVGNGRGRASQGVLVTLAIGLHNIPEGLAVATSLVARGVAARQALLWFPPPPPPLTSLAAAPFTCPTLTDLDIQPAQRQSSEALALHTS